MSKYQYSASISDIVKKVQVFNGQEGKYPHKAIIQVNSHFKVIRLLAGTNARRTHGRQMVREVIPSSISGVMFCYMLCYCQPMEFILVFTDLFYLHLKLSALGMK